MRDGLVISCLVGAVGIGLIGIITEIDAFLFGTLACCGFGIVFGNIGK